MRAQVAECEVSHAAVDEVKSRAAAAEARVQRAEAGLSREQASGTSVADCMFGAATADRAQ